MSKEQKAQKHYDEKIKEARNIMRQIAEEYVPQMCRAARDEYDEDEANKPELWTEEHHYYPEPDRDGIDGYITRRKYTDEELKHNEKLHIEFRNDYVKIKIMIDLQGELFQDKVFTKSGMRLLPEGPHRLRDKPIYEKVERKMVPMMKINRDTLRWEPTDTMIDNKGRGKVIKWVERYSEAKDMSEWAKLAEQLIDKEIASWKK